MNYKVLISLIVVLLLVGVLFAFLKHDKPKEDNPKELELTYEINAGIPFRWEYEIKDEDIVEFVRSYVVEDQNEKGALTGAPVISNYVFRGLKEGRTVITFKYVNFADNYVSGTKEHEVIVDKDLNISLVDNK